MTQASMLDVEVRASPIEGLGLFAARPFQAGERIRHVNVLREITAAAPLREDLGERQDHCDYPDGRVVLLGFPDRHTNHSCDPSAWVLYEGEGAYLVARRDIAAGDEITCDYNINIAGGTSWPCHCGAARCRGVTTGDYFLLPTDIQREYRALLADWFVRRHREQFAALDAGTLRSEGQSALPGRGVLRGLAIVGAVSFGLPAVGRLGAWLTGTGHALVHLLGPVVLAAIATVNVLLALRPLSRPLARLEGVFVGALGIGPLAFALGFIGPMILQPDSNLGPLLGFLTGPIGLVIGGIVGHALTQD